MKVGILTFHYADNYGAVLQAYALQTYLESLGHNVEIIDYRPRYITHGGRFRIPRSKKDLVGNAQVALIKISRLRTAISGRTSQKAFQSFRDTALHISTMTYTSLEDLKSRAPSYDAYICGSDQIWNPPPRAGVDPAFYLDFGEPKCRRIAYAASFGRPQIEVEYHKDIGRLLKKIDYISVREQSGIDLVQQLSGRTATWLPDPTLLVDNYDSVLTKIPQENHIFVYGLRTGALLQDVKEQVAKIYGAPVLAPFNAKQLWRSKEATIQLSPSEWLGAIQQAGIVVTNSFHGTLFSIIFRKPFITVPLVGRNAGLNTRFQSILYRLNLADRLLPSTNNNQDITRLIKAEIDWHDVYERLSAWRCEARDFVVSALGNSV